MHLGDSQLRGSRVVELLRLGRAQLRRYMLVELNFNSPRRDRGAQDDPSRKGSIGSHHSPVV